jgi:hypothetical protein
VNYRVSRQTALRNWLRAGAWDLTVSIAREIANGLKLLNHGGEYRVGGASNSRRQQAQEFKAALTEQYSQHTRCC